ncbi:MAG: DUF4301 family protein [Bacteroidales bacterium]|nr:DUF4301 family protein [Bacteroidales bacterium]
MNKTLTDGDLKQIESLGLTASDIEKQIENFRNGFSKSRIVAPATVENGGITRLSDSDVTAYEKAYRKLSVGKKMLKFVPASGAATRMFNDLYAFTSTYFGVTHNFEAEFPQVKLFLENLRSFAFFDDLNNSMSAAGLDLNDYMSRGDYTAIINFLLNEQYLGYGKLPKALIKFHKYGNIQRTSFEEHIVEGAQYAQSSDGKTRLHFTISPEHRPLFRKKIAEVKKYYESAFNTEIEIKFSEQKHYTDRIIVDEYNEPVRDDDGKLIFRPGGHGALIENLNECRADVIFIKNIDNVAPDWMKHTTIIYKKVLAGMLLSLQKEIFSFLEELEDKSNMEQLPKCQAFIEKKLHASLPEGFDSMTDKAKNKALCDILNRPLRICGMVRNQGEPGGGPFYTIDQRGTKSLQIVEPGQVNRKEPEQDEIFKSGTHFNPVDIVCSTRDRKGRYYDLRKYVDHSTGFISKKNKGSSIVKTQELPGLWNGSMAFWNTVFVEVPLATFNPVKTVNDLLRKEHQG